MSDELQVLTVTSSAAEQSTLLARLEGAGIRCTTQRPISVPANFAIAGRHVVLVRAADLERARGVWQKRMAASTKPTSRA
jgi:hypothetical protein